MDGAALKVVCFASASDCEDELCLFALIDGAWNDDCNGGLIVILSFWRMEWNVDSGLDSRILGVDLVEYIGKRSLFDRATTTNR